ncbi:BTB domain and ankyrin repeat protein [Verticillium alfalfae VaMs.102]|uniref:BTB domain and ankyrin repeat protein n=1 Tax=Verticillium alfalfae (strain VaMs.102 / ATCC MYA-4576 / FGSC 10136) TaxID=526221 RepID=C9SWL0_VERA1|nr:BTB domain and ankyrin repeat protein [Verticillium alfalfae VaMs.102]EEY23175.1 BTB domain and ankyrin repeat protein [Verticillium alfalfae VaMs.102]
MSHLLWKHYWEHDVDKFRRLLAPAGYSTQLPSRSPVVAASGSWGNSPGSHAAGTSPKTTKSRKPSGFGLNLGGARGSAGAALGKAEVNSRDHAGPHPPFARRVIHRSRCHPLRQGPTRTPSYRSSHSGILRVAGNALHRALYAGNISIARLLLDKERRILTEQTAGNAVAKVGQLIKTKDNEGNSPFDVYNSTIGTRNIKEPGNSKNEGEAHDSDSIQTTMTTSQCPSLPLSCDRGERSHVGVQTLARVATR